MLADYKDSQEIWQLLLTPLVKVGLTQTIRFSRLSWNGWVELRLRNTNVMVFTRYKLYYGRVIRLLVM